RRRRVCGRQGVARLPVDEDLGDGPVEQDHELPGESGSLAKSVSGENIFQPSLEASLVTGGGHARPMAWQLCGTGPARPQAAAPPARILGVLPKLLEDSTNSARSRHPALRDHALVTAQGRQITFLEIGGDQIVLAGEVIVERALGHAGRLGDSVNPNRSDALAVEQSVGCRDQAPASLR